MIRTQKSKRNLSYVYLTFTSYVYHFILYNTIFHNKSKRKNVKLHDTSHENCNHDLCLRGGIMKIYVYLSNHVGNSVNFGKQKKRLPGGSTWHLC
jgi:hypothetical protein